MAKIPLIPPELPPIPSKEEIKNIDWEKLEQNPSNQKYEKRLAKQFQRKADEELIRRKERRSEWWRNNWVAFIAMIFAFISALPQIIQGIDAMIKWLIQWNQ